MIPQHGSASRRRAAWRGALLLLPTIACAMPHAANEPSPPVAAQPGRAIDGEHVDASGTRAWRLWVPKGHDGAAPRPLLVMLHGCTQDPADVARGTRLDALADSLGMLVLYPGQPAGAHPLKCWNWFAPAHQARDAGEPAAIAALTRKVQSEWKADTSRTWIAGISAGGMMALITSVAYPELYAAVGLHSSLPWGVATTTPDALAAMAKGADAVPAAAERITGVAMAQAMGARAHPLPAIVFHGEADKVVHAGNYAALVRQLGDAYVQLSPNARFAEPRTEQVTIAGRTVTRSFAVGGAVEGWSIAGLGHAWSGGSAHGTYTDPLGPDATAEMLRFLAAHPARAGSAP